MISHAFFWAQSFMDTLDTDQPTPSYMKFFAASIAALCEVFREVNEQLKLEKVSSTYAK